MGDIFILLFFLNMFGIRPSVFHFVRLLPRIFISVHAYQIPSINTWRSELDTTEDIG